MYWYHPDHLGSSSFITGIDGEVNQNIEYFPSGETFVENHLNSYNTPYKFNSKELDDETGYYYYGARYYNPRVSLWLNVDPLFEKFPGRSPYEYTFSNPINLIDPTGMGPEDPSSNIVSLIKRYDLNIYNALKRSSNTSNNHLYRWSLGQTTGYNSLKGAIGESIIYDRVNSAQPLMLRLYGQTDNVILNGKYNGYQVDVQRFIATGRYSNSLGSVIAYLPMKANTFSGGTYIDNIGTSSNRSLYTINYEVKTLSSNPKIDISSTFTYLSNGIDQVNARGGTATDKTIGVLVTDTDAWNRVASDPTYGKLLQLKYNGMISRGNYLQLVNGLNSEANSKLFELRSKIRNESK